MNQICNACQTPITNLSKMVIVKHIGVYHNDYCKNFDLEQRSRIALEGTLEDALKKITIGYTTVLYGLAVTRWSETTFEVDTYNKKVTDLAKTVQILKRYAVQKG